MDFKKVALDQVHRDLGAKMVPFAGYEMPVRYSSDIEEHMQVRKSVGVFDVSHMGEFLVKGDKAIDLIQKISSNDASKLIDGKAQYSCLPNEKGGIVDDLLIYRIGGMEYLLVVNAANIEKDWEWIKSHNTDDVEIEDISNRTSLLAVQGPKALQVLNSLTSIDLGEIGYYNFVKGEFAGVEDVIVSATGYTGSGGLELYIPNDKVHEVWSEVFESGRSIGIQPIGLGARDTLRLEAGFCLYGNDIDDNTSPLEAGLGWITKFSKDFINSTQLKAQKEVGVKKKLIGLKMAERGIPRPGYSIHDSGGHPIGKVTSGTISPMLNTGIGMGYVDTRHSAIGNEIYIDVRGRRLPAQIVKPPFVTLN